jgi:putative endonuclease
VAESVKQPLKLKKRVLSSQQKQLPNFRVGEQGEHRAARFLLQKGYLILDLNVRFGALEIDIVAVDTVLKEVVFVEVKSRSAEFFGDPSRAVNWRKLQALRRAAKNYLREKQWKDQALGEWEYRFDVVSVLPTTVDHYQNVTW